MQNYLSRLFNSQRDARNSSPPRNHRLLPVRYIIHVAVSPDNNVVASLPLFHPKPNEMSSSVFLLFGIIPELKLFIKEKQQVISMLPPTLNKLFLFVKNKKWNQTYNKANAGFLRDSFPFEKWKKSWNSRLFFRQPSTHQVTAGRWKSDLTQEKSQGYSGGEKEGVIIRINKWSCAFQSKQ